MLRKVFTLVFIKNESQILLGYKKRGFGVNKWNGFGGKVEQNETVISAAVRELNEECGLEVNECDLKNIGQLEFTFVGDSALMDVRVFSTNVFNGRPRETEEMSPKWFRFDEIPYRDMWPDDRIWLPYMLNGKIFYGRFNYLNMELIKDCVVEEWTSMEEFYKTKRNGNGPHIVSSLQE